MVKNLPKELYIDRSQVWPDDICHTTYSTLEDLVQDSGFDSETIVGVYKLEGMKKIIMTKALEDYTPKPKAKSKKKKPTKKKK